MRAASTVNPPGALHEPPTAYKNVAPSPVQSPPTNEFSELSISIENSASKTATKSASYDRLTWARTCIKDVVYNAGIKAWLDHDPAFANWLRTCVMVHADSGAFETKCTIPDQWREDVGEFVTIVTANCIPRRQGTVHEVKEGVYHVMA